MVGERLPAPAAAPAVQVHVWSTYADQSKLLRRDADLLFTDHQSLPITLDVDDTKQYQSVAGFGASITESSAVVLGQAPAAARSAAMTALFSRAQGIGISYLRQPLGASDFALSPYSFNEGAPDWQLTRFSTARDEKRVLPVIRSARAINPELRLMLTPWSAPGWMKTSGSLIHGTLRSNAQGVYAEYLRRAVAVYAAKGGPVDAMTMQNEPSFSPANYPGMTLTVAQEAALADLTRKALDRAGLTKVRLVGHDHNWDGVNRAIQLARATPSISGVAFHCYGGDAGALARAHAALPGRDVYQSECTAGAFGGGFASDLLWAARNLVVRPLRGSARTVTMWNVALDQRHGPHSGGCGNCEGLLSIDTSTGKVHRNSNFYALGHISKFVRPGAVRTWSTDVPGSARSVAFRNPDGSHVLMVVNESKSRVAFSVRWQQRLTRVALPAGAVTTLTW